MKQLLILPLIILTGCAQVSQHVQERIERATTSSIDLAKRDCQKIGYTENHPQYPQCVQKLSIKFMEQRTAYIGGYTPQNNYAPRQVQCRQIGSSIHCNELGW